MHISPTEILGTVCFSLALAHTFSVSIFQRMAERYPSGSVGENLYHLLGEVEVVFGCWAAIFMTGVAFIEGGEAVLTYLSSLNFTEPAFVFVILGLCSTKPLLNLVFQGIRLVSRSLPLPGPLAFYFTALVVGPLLGSFITEPAAMTVTALIMLERFFSKNLSTKLMYASLGLLFVNVSIGGVMTPYAAPPVLMVAAPWGWDLGYMLTHFGWRGAVACVVSSGLTTWYFRKELSSLKWDASASVSRGGDVPIWVTVLHVLFLIGIVLSAHHMVIFVPLFLFFLGLVRVTKEYQDQIKLREGLLVGFFLGGLVVLGGPQRWWLEPLLSHMGSSLLFWGATALTAVTDNAALTYLGSQVPELSELAKNALVSGAVVGGGLTVIANAPNPAGYGILNSSFKDGGIHPSLLFLAALPPTFIAAIFFWLI